MQISEHIKSIRVKLGKTQAQFAELFGITRDRIANYESGRSKITADLYLEICDQDPEKPEPHV